MPGRSAYPVAAQTIPARPASRPKRAHLCPPSPSSPALSHPHPLTSSHPAQLGPCPAQYHSNPIEAQPALSVTPSLRLEILDAKPTVTSRGNSYNHCIIYFCNATRGFQRCFGQGRGLAEYPRAIKNAAPYGHPTGFATVIVTAIRPARSPESSPRDPVPSCEVTLSLQ